MKTLLFLLIPLVFCFSDWTNAPSPPQQPAYGPGGKEYKSTNTKSFCSGFQEDDYWLFYPETKTQQELPVIVFMHGYSAYNPMVYGKWIKHLVQKGNILIFPRYQKGILGTHHSKFVQNTNTAIHSAFTTIDSLQEISYDQSPLTMVGHSFGGAITANMLANWEVYNLPEVSAAFLLSPGVGPMKKFLLDSYESIPSQLKLLIIGSENDHVVGTAFGKMVYKNAIHTKERNLILQISDSFGDPAISAGHLECYCPDPELDSGEHGYSYKRSKTAKTDAVDFYAYWKLFDGLREYALTGQGKEFIFGNTLFQRTMGNWSDGTKVNELVVKTP